MVPIKVNQVGQHDQEWSRKQTKTHISINNQGTNNENKDMIVHIDKEERLYDKPLSCFGCGIGWLLFLLGFAIPLLWYLATILYFGNYCLNDPRERQGLAASAIAALICSVIVLLTLLAVFCQQMLQS